MSYVVMVWYTRMTNQLLVGISVGVVVCVLHGGFKNLEGLFLDENNAVLDWLNAPKLGPGFQ